MTYRRLIAFSLPSGIVPAGFPMWQISAEFPVFDQEVESHFGEVSRFPSLG